jgi:hypothetical protein
VLTAYGLPADTARDQIFAHLLELNHSGGDAGFVEPVVELVESITA